MQFQEGKYILVTVEVEKEEKERKKIIKKKKDYVSY